MLARNLEFDVHQMVVAAIQRQAPDAEAGELRYERSGRRVELDRARKLVVAVLEAAGYRQRLVRLLEGNRRLLLAGRAAACFPIISAVLVGEDPGAVRRLP